MSRLPNFFVVGAPKAGTTSLYHYLDQHPGIYMSAIKEPCFFSTEFRAENFDPFLRRMVARSSPDLSRFLGSSMREKRFGGIVTAWEDYQRLFGNAITESALGEASVCYLWSRSAPERIAARIPRARILVLLRDPAERAFSQYLHGVGYGAIRWSFREHIHRNLSDTSQRICIHYPFLEFGLYSQQLARYQARFGPNVWVGLHEDLRGRPQEMLQDIYRFLGVDSDFSPDTSRRHLESHVPRTAALRRLKGLGLWQAAAEITPLRLRPFIRRAFTRCPSANRIEPADRNYLIDFYRQDITNLSALLDRDLSHWLQPRDQPSHK
jgi:hypothetical protein